MYPDWDHVRPIGGIVLTLLAVIAWLVFILLYALYWSSGFDLFQNIVVVIVINLSWPLMQSGAHL